MPRFKSVVIEYGAGPSDARNQALQILNQMNTVLHRDPTIQRVGITYSANQDQTEKIAETYARGGWKTGTSGANQAAVIREIELELGKNDSKYAHLRDKFRIVPITTMKYDERGQPARADDRAVKASLDAATAFANTEGCMLLGWQNQKTPQGKLAIGGGVSAGIAGTENQRKMIDEWAATLMRPTPVALSRPTTSADKWARFHEIHERSAPSFYTKGTPMPIHGSINASGIAGNLYKTKEVPMVEENKTYFDYKLTQDKVPPSEKKHTSELLVAYSLKAVMGDMNIMPHKMEAVKNTRAGTEGHDNTAMKIQFGSDQEAREFSQKLLKDYGIHSLTFGKGKEKTPQNGALYLTKNDLNALAKKTGLAMDGQTGERAYAAIEASKPKKAYVSEKSSVEKPEVGGHRAGPR